MAGGSKLPGMLLHRVLLSGAFVMIASGHLLVAQVKPSPRPAPTETARSVFNVLDGSGMGEYLPLGPDLTADGWKKLIAGYGLKPMPGGGMWHLIDATGEVRTQAFFQDQHAFYVLFFPAERTPMPDPLLTWLLAHGTPRLQSDRINLVMDEEGLSAPGRSGTRHKELLITITGGVLVRLSTSITWKAAGTPGGPSKEHPSQFPR